MNTSCVTYVTTVLQFSSGTQKSELELLKCHNNVTRLEIRQYCDVWQYIMFQCAYQYCELNIDILMDHCVLINKMFSKIHNSFKFKNDMRKSLLQYCNIFEIISLL